MSIVIASYLPFATWVRNGKPPIVTSIESYPTPWLSTAATSRVRSWSVANLAANRSPTTAMATRTRIIAIR